MAGTWRVAIESVQVYGRQSILGAAKQALHALDRRKSFGYDDEDSSLKQLVVELVTSPGGAQKTKLLDIPEDGQVRVDKVFFVGAPARGTPLVVRLLKPKGAGEWGLIGEAQVAEASGRVALELLKRGKVRASMQLSATSGLPVPPANGWEVPTSSPAAAVTASPPTSGVHYSSGEGSVQEALLAEVPIEDDAFGDVSPYRVATAGAGRPSLAPPPTASAEVRLPTASFGAATASTAARAAAGAAAAALAAADRAGRLPTGKRPLRTRPPNLPLVGTCDVRVHQVGGLGNLRHPYLIVGLEGQEFRAEEVEGRGNLAYTFNIGSVQSNLVIYVYQDLPTAHWPVGRILVPLSDVLWPVGEVPELARVRSGFEKEERPYRREYILNFLPPSEGGDGYLDVAFLDTYSPGAIDSARRGAFGYIKLELEVLLRSEAQPLLAFYATSVLASAQRVARMGEEGGIRRLRTRRRGGPDDLGDPSTAEAFLRSPELRNTLRAAARLRAVDARPCGGLRRWLREQPLHGYLAAGGWFVFCILGFFPCSLFMVPIYVWLLLLLNGLFSAIQREQDWKAHTPGDPPLFWRDDVPGSADSGSVAGGADSSKDLIARTLRALREAEPFLLTEAGYRERLRNLLGFADGAASVASFAGLGLLTVALALALLFIQLMDPGLYFVCGVYGAIGLVAYSRSPHPAAGAALDQPAWWQWAFNEAFACVPDDAQVAHRFVATRVQRAPLMPL